MLGFTLILFLFLSGCQTNTTLNETEPIITVTVENKEIKTGTRVYCWNNCAANEDMGSIHLPDMTENLEPVSVSPGTQISFSFDETQQPTKISYIKQQNNDITEKILDDEQTIEVHGQEGVQYYLIIADWYGADGETLLGRAATPFVVSIKE